MNKNYKYSNGKVIIGTDQGLVESALCVDNVGARLATENETLYWSTKINEDANFLSELYTKREEKLKYFKRYLGAFTGACVAAPIFFCVGLKISFSDILFPLAISESIVTLIGGWFSLAILADGPSKRKIADVKNLIAYEQSLLEQKMNDSTELEKDTTCSNCFLEDTIYELESDFTQYDDFREVVKDYLEHKIKFLVLYKMGRLEDYLRNRNCQGEAIVQFLTYIESDIKRKTEGKRLILERKNTFNG